MRLCFKQKTAYEMRISDWSSDVCSSDLQGDAGGVEAGVGHRRLQHQLPLGLREVLAEGALRGQAEQLGRRALAGHRQAAAWRQRDHRQSGQGPQEAPAMETPDTVPTENLLRHHTTVLQSPALPPSLAAGRRR